jgi:hypothetical protein
MLGSVLVEMEPGNWNTCALGVAGSAAGIRVYINGWNEDGEREEVEDREKAICLQWPWLNDKCFDEDGDSSPFQNEIFNRFDDLVCIGAMTFEQLVDYVRCIEPACGECNRFECTCVPAEVADKVEHAIVPEAK